ncbi:unnamed protein product [Prunus armeniaca]
MVICQVRCFKTDLSLSSTTQPPSPPFLSSSRGFLKPPAPPHTTAGHGTSQARTAITLVIGSAASQPPAAAPAAGNSRFFTELSSSRSPSSGHQIGLVRYGFLAIFHVLAAGWVGFQRFQA